jgi:lipoate-protein ligase A
MSETWFLLQSGACHFAWNMALDEALLESSPQIGKPVLRFYGWTEPAGSFGYSQRFSELERVTHLRPLVRRPTGGGLVPHNSDWTYSLAFPPTHFWYSLKAVESYQKVHEWIRDAFQEMGVATELAPHAKKEMPGQCFVGAEKSDDLWHGRKIVGAAQRRTKSGLLIQGSVQPPPIGLDKTEWREAMCDVARRQFSVIWNDFAPDVTLLSLTKNLAERKYSQPSYNQKR